MGAALPKLAQSMVVSGLRRAGNFSQKNERKRNRPYKGAHGAAMFRFLGGGGVGVADGVGDPEEPLLLWQNVSLTYEGVPTLASVSGYVRAGDFVCVLGPGSGSDRLALLDVLSGRAVSGAVEGRFAYDGRRFSKEHLTELSTFVPQESSFLAHATVEEAAYFVARLRLPTSTADANITKVCDWTLKLLELDASKAVFVGGPLGEGRTVAGLSAAQRRQLSIAVGLVARPRLMFAEAPTRGLDAAAALGLMRLVAGLCRSGETRLAAICAVDQPRRTLWHLFQSCYVMSCGHVLYAGPSRGAVPWFVDLGYFDGDATRGTGRDAIVFDFTSTCLGRPSPGS